MKRAYFVCLFCLTTTFLLSQSNSVTSINQNAGVVSPIAASQADQKAQAKILDGYGKLPLSFEANHGQTDARVKFLSRTGGYTLFLRGNEAVFAWSGSAAKKPAPKGAPGFGGGTVSLKRNADTKPNLATAPGVRGGVLRMKLRNANLAAKVTGQDELAGTSNYFIGNDPAKWRTKVPTYGKVKYEGIYSGIDLVYYGNQRQLEYDFIVAPGADPGRIAFDVRGANRIRRDKRGDLVFKVSEGEIRWHKPVVYQEKDGARQLVAARYAVMDRGRVRFDLAKYDTSRTLYIDPVIYSTYLGGSGEDLGNGIAVDSAGNAYVTGCTNSTNFPTMNPFQPAYGGPPFNDCGLDSGDAFVTKINSEGSALVYSTYLGGSGGDSGYGIAVDSAGNAYVTGNTCSSDFPTVNPLQPTYGGGSIGGCGDAFVSKINPAGSALVYSTYLGGSNPDFGTSITLDSAGNAYVTGQTISTDFPTMNAFQPANHAGRTGFVTKINTTGSALVYSTYLGGSVQDQGNGIAVDSASNAYVTGYTDSGFPVTPGAFQTTPAPYLHSNAFVTKFNPAGSALVYSTYLHGSNGEIGNSIAVDGAGNAYVTGATWSTDFPTKNPLQATSGGRVDAFVAKINPTGSALVYSTYLGGWTFDEGLGIAVDSARNAYVTGVTASDNFPVTKPTKAYDGYYDAFVSKINPAGSVLVSSSYVGPVSGNHIAVDNARNAYVTGYTNSTNFPTKNPLQAAYGGGAEDAFVAKIDMRAVPTITLSSSPNPSSYGQAVTFTALLTSTIGAPPDGETVSFMKGTKVLGTGTLSGGTATFTTSTLPAAANYVKAVYGGDSTFSGSTSKAVKQVVNKATTTTTLTSSLNPSTFGQSVTFTATVKPQSSGTVKGTVTFYDGTTALKTEYLSGGVAKYTTSTLSVGSHTITATYNGNVDFDGSSASLTQKVN